MPLKFSEIIDIKTIQPLMESLYRASGIPVGIVGPDGEILIATGWQPICTDFHRKHPQTEARCRESDCYLKERLHSKQPLPPCGYVEYRCKNGMIDIAMPIIIEGEYLATLFLGQFFYEPPDEGYFRRQAAAYSFDEKAYLDALRQVPIFPREKVEAILEYQSGFVTLLASMGFEKLKRLRTEETLRTNRERFKSLLETLPHGVQECNAEGTVTYANRAFHTMNGYEPGELIGTSVWSRLASKEEKENLKAYLKELVSEQPQPTPYISQNQTRDGRIIDIRVDWNYQRNEEGEVVGFLSVITDISEQQKAIKDLEEKERQISTLMENLPGMVYSCHNDPNWTMEFVSSGCETLTGHPPEDLLKNAKISYSDLVHPDDRKRIWSEIQNALSEKMPYTLEYRIVHADRTVRWVWEQGRAVFRPDGTLKGLEGYITDITERKAAEEEIASLARFPQENRNPVLRLREDGALLFANDSATPLLNFFVNSGGDAKGGFWQNLVRNVLLNEKAVTLEKECNDRTYSFHCTPVSEGKYVNIYGRDVTRRREAEEALKKALKEAETARDRIDAILKSVVDGLIVTDMNNRIILLNRTAETLLGTSLSEAINHPLCNIRVPEEFPEEINKILKGMSETHMQEWEVMRPDKRRLMLQARSAAVQSRDGTRRGTITLLQDITQAKEMDRIKDEFISTAAHELQTPLTSILGYADILLQPDIVGGIGDMQKREFLEIIREKGICLKQIIRDLLDLSHINLGRVMSLQKSSGDIARMLKTFMVNYSRVTKGYLFNLDISDRPAIVSFDPLKIEQVLDNLVSNAVKFSPEKGVISVTGKEEGLLYRITIQDEGVGMTEGEVARIFEKFYRADSSNTAKEGLGLGMSIVKNIIDAHGGQIHVMSTPGRGTTVTVELPLEGK